MTKVWLSSMLLLASSSSAIEVGFCDSTGSGFLSKQPPDQLERWEKPLDNGTHLVIPWRIDRRVANRNVTSYFVDVTTSLPVLNLFVGRFGGFPQDLCAPGGSKAREAVKTAEAVRKPTCSPYAADAASVDRMTAFEIPDALRTIASWDVTVIVRGYGSHAPIGRPEEAVPGVWWCHVYRREPGSFASAASSAAAPEAGAAAARPWLRSVWDSLPCLWACPTMPPGTNGTVSEPLQRRYLPRCVRNAWRKLTRRASKGEL